MRSRVVFIAVVLLASTILVTCGHDHERGTSVPAIMTVGQPQSDTVVRLGFNDYAAAVTPGALYKISITSPTDDTDLLVFGADSSYTVLATCAINNTSIIGTSPEDCIMTAPGSTLYFSVDGTFLTAGAASYVIDIELLTETHLTLQTPLSDSTTQRSAVVYTVPVSPGVAYTIGMTGLSDDVDLFVFGNDNTFTALATCSIDNTRFIGTTPEDCTWTSSAGTLYFIVDGIFSSAAVVQYTVLATPAPVVPVPSNEGSLELSGSSLSQHTNNRTGGVWRDEFLCSKRLDCGNALHRQHLGAHGQREPDRIRQRQQLYNPRKLSRSITRTSP